MFRIKSFTGPVSLALFAVAVFAPSFVLADTISNYVANLAPINDNGNFGVNPTASGLATLQLTTSPTVDTLAVTINATGLEPDQYHAQHIHGFGAGGPPAMTPTLANADPDHDGLINLADGGVEYGPIQLNLVTSGAIVPGPGNAPLTDFPFSTDGTVHFSQTYTFNLSNPTDAGVINAILPLDHNEIVLHGLTVPDGTESGTPQPGTSSFDPVFPVASGEIVGVITATPEPTSFALLSTGLIGLGWLARRRAVHR